MSKFVTILREDLQKLLENSVINHNALIEDMEERAREAAKTERKTLMVQLLDALSGLSKLCEEGL